VQCLDRTAGRFAPKRRGSGLNAMLTGVATAVPSRLYVVSRIVLVWRRE
jgi:hypothetical protein